MIFQGKSLTCSVLEPAEGIAELRLDLQGESVNKFNQLTLGELEQALAELEKSGGVKGLLFTSGKGVFSVGADINEFLAAFRMETDELAEWIGHAQKIFNRLEDLPFPSVAAVNGYALGGGMEAAMAATYRVIAAPARMGQPEVKLGLIPGFGGTVRLPRLIGADNAVELIASGREVKADEALKLHLVSAVVEPDDLREAALALLRRVMGGEGWQAVRQVKLDPLLLNGIERAMAFTTAKAFVAQQAGPFYPAPVKAVEVMEQAATDGRDAALEKEAAAFAELAKTPEAASLVQIFLGDQFLKKRAKGITAAAKPVAHAAVIGAGIMGGGIAYQSASRGVPVILKDIGDEPLQAAFGEIARLLDRQVERGRIDRTTMARTISAVQGTMSYGDFGHADICVEAVVENPEVKRKVLAEAEAALPDDAILATNTSTISIDSLAGALKRPDRFCGMHFFNPVHRMPLVEVIRGKESSDEAIGTVVAYAQKMGKTPVVVADGPGFLVNRILGPYMLSFQLLVADGASIEEIDQTLENFGWPMGPAYLSDVVGLDTVHHAGQVMLAAFGERISIDRPLPGQVLYEAGYYGQKNSKGYYRYTPDRKGRPQKKFDPDVYQLLEPAIRTGGDPISGEEMVERMMLPMVIEAAVCLETGIVETPTELDMALVLGIGFPPFRGGLMRYADGIGLKDLCASADRYANKGPLYEPTAKMREMGAAGRGFYD
ncbi:MAG: fatty acid oxidation complex subunit alpha FadB [SAR324 cluster bacterium]|nr:fatty acid oxidation complex subunit alpha FadB [SAR324 cluster bacterium]